MTGFVPLFRKELLEQRRTWRFVAMVLVFTLVAVLVPVIARIVVAAQDGSHGAREARDLIRGIGGTISGLGTFLAIIMAMGALAGERSTGTAAMTLSKPVTRSAFVAAKFLAITLSIFAAVAFSGILAYVLTSVLFDAVSAGRFAVGMVVVASYLLFISLVTLLWSSISSRQMLVGGIAFASLIVLQVLSAIPHAERYLPVSTPVYANGLMGAQTTDQWPAFAVAMGCIVVLSLAAWAVFRRQEL